MSAPARRSAAAALLAVLGAGCSVGPDYRAPTAALAERYLPASSSPQASVPEPVARSELPTDWWTVFGSSQIDALVQRALADSPTLVQARARVRQAQELLTARSGSVDAPQIDATAGASRQLVDPATFGFPQAPVPPPFNVFSLGARVHYDFDLAGGARRELEAMAAEVDYQRYELEAARLALAGGVVLAAIRGAALDAQIDAYTAIVAAQRRQLAIIEGRAALGAVSALELRTQQMLTSQVESSLPALHAQRALVAHQLAVLGGEEPALAAPVGVRLAQLSLPAALPLRLPSELVQQRPDIRASEALLRKASANVGLATADLYPKLVVSGAFSTSQLQLADLFGNGINVWSLGANLVQPLFRGGELRARQRAAEAAYEQALAGYRSTVLSGLQNVADVLRLLEGDSAALAARTEQAARADEACRIVRGRHQAGAVSEFARLDADRLCHQAAIDLALAQAARYADAAALFQALGGGRALAGGEPPRP